MPTILLRRAARGRVLGAVLLALAAGAAGAAGAAEAPLRSFALHVDGERVQGPDVIRVAEGDRVSIRLTADRPISARIEGYGLALDARPGRPGVVVFRADRAGRFPVTRGRPDGAGGPPLFVLEVAVP